MISKIWKKGKPKSEKIWKIQKKIVKRYEKYENLLPEQGFRIYLPAKGKQISVHRFKFIYFLAKGK
jgi:hypothetical protein